MTFELEAIGNVIGGREDVRDDEWGGSRAIVRLDSEQFGPEALAGLADFSHAEVIFVFDRVPVSKIERGARHPRGRADWPLVGIFAQRGKNRPNRIGVTVCRIVRVEGLDVEVEGLDAVSGTPVLDIKPVMREFLPRSELRQPDWSHELMADYW